MNDDSIPLASPLRRAAGALVALAATAASLTAQTPESSVTSPHQAIVSAVEHMASAFARSDLGGVMDAYEPQATVAFQPGEPVSGAPELRRMFTNAFTASPRFTFGEHEVIVSGDLALHLTPWTMRGTAPDGKQIQQEGLSVAVLRKQGDGRWLLVIDNPHGQRLLRTP